LSLPLNFVMGKRDLEALSGLDQLSHQLSHQLAETINPVKVRLIRY